MKPTKLRHYIFAGVALLCAPAMIPSAVAKGTGSETPIEVVKYQDLNLARPEAIRVLYRRIEQAADRVCGRVSPRELTRFLEYRDCRRRAVSEAVEQIDVPALTAFHRDRTDGARA